MGRLRQQAAVGHGPISPQTLAGLNSDYGMMIQWDQHVGGMGEDCLSLNVWTPGVNDGGKRAVMVSFHGGGFSTGSGNSPGYDGAQLAKFGDVVVVTVNHRLAGFGYLHLADLGAPPEFAQAGVVGMLDLVASLQWVRENIASFGGDPARAMIFGQSGVGAGTFSPVEVEIRQRQRRIFQRGGDHHGHIGLGVHGEDGGPEQSQNSALARLRYVEEGHHDLRQRGARGGGSARRDPEILGRHPAGRRAPRVAR